VLIGIAEKSLKFDNYVKSIKTMWKKNKLYKDQNFHGVKPYIPKGINMKDKTIDTFTPMKIPRGKLSQKDKVQMVYDPIERTLKIFSKTFYIVHEKIKPEVDFRAIFWMGTHEGNQLEIEILE